MALASSVLLEQLFGRSAGRSVRTHKENNSVTDKFDLASIRFPQSEYREITVSIQVGKRDRHFVCQSFRRKNELNFRAFLMFHLFRERFRDVLQAPVADIYGDSKMDILEHIPKRLVFVHKPIGGEPESH